MPPSLTMMTAGDDVVSRGTNYVHVSGQRASYRPTGSARRSTKRDRRCRPAEPSPRGWSTNPPSVPSPRNRVQTSAKPEHPQHPTCPSGHPGASELEEDLDRAALVHGAVPLGDLLERQGQIEDLAGIDYPVVTRVKESH